MKTLSRGRQISRKKAPGNKLPKWEGEKSAVTAGKQFRAQFSIVGIGASAGRLEAFTQLLRHLPLDTGMGFVLVQHLDPARPSALTELLAKATRLPVREVTRDSPVKPNHVYVISPNTNLAIERGVLKLRPRQKRGEAQRSVDFFLESLAQDQHERAIGVILSGAASDGTLGLEMIKAEGGITFAQDHSARYDSMPRSAVAAGCVDFVLAPEKIAKELARIAKHPYVARLEETIAASEPAERSSDTLRSDAPTKAGDLKKSCFFCAIVTGLIFLSTDRARSSGASTGEWC